MESGLSYYKTDKEELLKNIEKEEWDGEVINMNNLSINKYGDAELEYDIKIIKNGEIVVYNN